MRDGINREKPLAPLLTTNWLSALQVLTMRQKSGSAEGFFFAAKGGHNAESHNHNDVGNFVLYLDGEPGIIDAGVDTYTKQTFGKDRYSGWNMQSQWHNCPTINGTMQKNGREFEATDMIFQPGIDKSSLEMNIAKAYPLEAGVLSWKRNFVFNTRKGELAISENYKLDKITEPVQIHFLTSMEPNTLKDGILKLTRNGKSLILGFDPKLFEVVIEQKDIADGRLQAIWGNKLKRITLRSKNLELTGSHRISFSQ